MNCHYCNKPCRCNVSSWICDTCPAEFFDGHINLYTTIKGKKFTFQMLFEHTNFPARIFTAGFNLDLPKIPDNITPSNVNEKVRLYLLFS